MEDFLAKQIGKRLDVYCSGASSLRGDVIKVEGGILHLRDEDGKNCYVAIDKIVVGGKRVKMNIAPDLSPPMSDKLQLVVDLGNIQPREPDFFQP